MGRGELRKDLAANSAKERINRSDSRKAAKAAKGSKFEARNPKLETISNDKSFNVPNDPDSDLSFGF
jgi:hypothetical protein